jgi:hypothetical protein
MRLVVLFNGQRETLFPEGEAFLGKRGVKAPLHTWCLYKHRENLLLWETKFFILFIQAHNRAIL